MLLVLAFFIAAPRVATGSSPVITAQTTKSVGSPGADTALYAAKAAGRNTFRMFKPDHGAGIGDPRATA